MITFNFFGDNARLHHIGLAVFDIHHIHEQVEIHHDPIQKVSVAFCELNGVPIEFVAPMAEGSPVDQSIKKGNKLIHLCFEVPDINYAVERSESMGFHRIKQLEPAVAFQGRRIAWLYHQIFGLFELLESECNMKRT